MAHHLTNGVCALLKTKQIVQELQTCQHVNAHVHPINATTQCGTNCVHTNTAGVSTTSLTATVKLSKSNKVFPIQTQYRDCGCPMPSTCKSSKMLFVSFLVHLTTHEMYLTQCKLYHLMTHACTESKRQSRL